MAISYAEKQHWKERIGSKLDARIQALKLQNPKFFQGIEAKARQQALASLGITAQLERMEQLDAEIDRMGEELKDIACALITTVSGKETERYYASRSKIDALLKPHIAKATQELLRTHKLGKQVADLEAEKENLMDTIWLATSPRQMSEMWIKALKLIGEETTAFQRDILTVAKEA